MPLIIIRLATRNSRRELARRLALTATSTDKRRYAWALELLERRNAVARWRGQQSCSLYEAVQLLDLLL
jgi:hypothetical protein